MSEKTRKDPTKDELSIVLNARRQKQQDRLPWKMEKTVFKTKIHDVYTTRVVYCVQINSLCYMLR